MIISLDVKTVKKDIKRYKDINSLYWLSPNFLQDKLAM
jgi:hypothetical protein